MKMKYIGVRSSRMSLISGHVYECTGYQCVIGDKLTNVLKPIKGKTMFVKIIDEEDEEYLYPMAWFEKVDTK